MCIRDRIGTVRLVISHGVNVNAKLTGSNYVVLCHAAYGGDADICRLLLEHGADVELGNKDGDTPLTLAASQGRESICELLVAKGADPNRYAPNGCLALTQAAWKGYAKICALLISAGADTNQTDKFQGSFPLLNATYEQSDDGEGSLETCIVLLDAGADINQADSSGLTTLMDVAKKGDVRICQLLLTRGADINLADKKGLNAMAHAVSGGCLLYTSRCV